MLVEPFSLRLDVLENQRLCVIFVQGGQETIRTVDHRLQLSDDFFEHLDPFLAVLIEFNVTPSGLMVSPQLLNPL